MPQVGEPFSQFNVQGNNAPDLIILEQSFLLDGKAISVDNDLRLELTNLNTGVIIQELTFYTSPKIERKITSGGVYYFARIDLNLFEQSLLEAKWYAKTNGIKWQQFPVTTIHGNSDTNEKFLLAAEVRDWVLRKLGYPKVSIELEQSHFSDAIDDALTLYNRWNPKIEYGNIDLVGTKKEYDLKPPAPGRGIMDVQFRRKAGNPIVSDPMFGRDYVRATQIDFDQYVLGTSFTETLLRTTGQDQLWRWLPQFPTKLYIDVGNGSRGFYLVTYVYACDRRLEEITPPHQLLFKKAVLSFAKSALGEVREKFGNKVATANGEIQLNGTQLKEQAEKELEQVTEDIKGLQLPIWPNYTA